jgi:predicted nucleotidyltransferase component of viral defense system
MKEDLLALLRRTPPERAANVAREWLQAAVLESLERSGAMATLAFHGGTALRFLYGIRRFSEDLDFSVHAGQAAPAMDLEPWLERVQRDLWHEGIVVRIGLARRARTHEARLDFRARAEEVGLSALSVKVEASLDPPRSAGVAVSVCRLHRLIRVRQHDPATLLAGKLHAILQRHYTKGRDYFDLVWYLGDRKWPEPNLDFLNSALRQTAWKRGDLTPDTWRPVVRERLARVDWKAARADVMPFLEEPRDAELLALDTLTNMLER